MSCSKTDLRLEKKTCQCITHHCILSIQGPQWKVVTADYQFHAHVIVQKPELATGELKC